MFHLFRKQDVDEKKVDDFVAWFIENGDRIRLSVENRENDRRTMLSVLDEVESQLAIVYRDGYKGRIEFDYGGANDAWDLNLYHKNKPFLNTATGMIANKINQMDNCIWTVHTDR